MSEQTAADTGHAAAVMAIYEAFARGDVPSILGALADDVEWDHGVRETGLPWLVAGDGHSHVVRFFQALGAGMSFTRFEPTAVCTSADGRTVMVSIIEAATNNATGKVVDEDVWCTSGDSATTAS